MFNIGLPELLIIVAIALIVFGPNKLPELAKAFGKAMREFKKATEEVKESFEAETKDLEELKDTLTQENLLADLAEDIATSTEPSTETPPSEKGTGTSEAATEAIADHEALVSSETPSQQVISTPTEDPEVRKEKREVPEGGGKGPLPMDEKKLPLTTHLQELRKRLILSFIAVGGGFALCYTFAEKIFDILAAPLLEMMPQGGSLIFTSVAEAFFTYMKVAFVAGLILASPFVLYQIWAFVAPGLYRHEKKYVVPFVLAGSFFFALGIFFGYYVALPIGFKFLLGFATDFIKPLPSMKEYLSFSIKFLLAFGLVFEFPVVLVLLARIGVVDARTLARQRKYAILLIFVFAAILTPPDIVSQVIVALPMIGLYELSILLSKLFGKKSPPAQPAT